MMERAIFSGNQEVSLFDALSQLVEEPGHTYSYDALYKGVNFLYQEYTYRNLNEMFSENSPVKEKRKKRNSPPSPDPRAEGSPHFIIEKPGKEGQYTTYNGNGTWKQYRGNGNPQTGEKFSDNQGIIRKSFLEEIPK